MSFDTSAITEVFPPLLAGRSARTQLDQPGAAGTYFQVYVEGRLSWYGTATHCVVSSPIGGGQIQIDIGR